MKKLRNPYMDIPGYFCFGCSPLNSSGLRMEFFAEKDEIISYWEPEAAFQGYRDVLHGGIQATLMDEIASWAVQVLIGTTGVTSSLETRFHKPVFISGGKLTLRAKVSEIRRNIATINVELFDAKDEKCASCRAVYFTFRQEVAIRDYHYRGKESFFTD